jgi:hypothetical protein
MKKDIEEDTHQGIPQKIADNWRWLNEEYIKPKLICDFPQCIDEDEELNNGIKAVMEGNFIKKQSGDLKPTQKSSSRTINMDEMARETPTKGYFPDNQL